MIEISNRFNSKFTSKLLKGAGIGMVCVSFFNCNNNDSQKNLQGKEGLKHEEIFKLLVLHGAPEEVAKLFIGNLPKRFNGISEYVLNVLNFKECKDVTSLCEKMNEGLRLEKIFKTLVEKGVPKNVAALFVGNIPDDFKGISEYAFKDLNLKACDDVISLCKEMIKAPFVRWEEIFDFLCRKNVRRNVAKYLARYAFCELRDCRLDLSKLCFCETDSAYDILEKVYEGGESFGSKEEIFEFLIKEKSVPEEWIKRLRSWEEGKVRWESFYKTRNILAKLNFKVEPKDRSSLGDDLFLYKKMSCGVLGIYLVEFLAKNPTMPWSVEKFKEAMGEFLEDEKNWVDKSWADNFTFELYSGEDIFWTYSNQACVPEFDTNDLLQKVCFTC